MHCRYEFRDYLLDPMTHELRRAGALVAVPPHAFACLTYLIDHRDRVVGKDELIAAILGRVDGSDDQLGHVVRKARRAIGERGDEQRAIRTIPRVGFRWVEEVRALTNDPLAQPEQSGTSPASERAPAKSVPRRSPAIPIIFLAIALAMGAGALASYWFKSGMPQKAAADTSQQSTPPALTDGLAVVPAVVTTDSDDLSWIRLGLMDFIGNRLREGTGLVVIASDNVVGALGGNAPANLTPEKVQARLGVRKVVFPLVKRSGGDWIVRLDERAPGGSIRTVEAHASDLIAAAKGAADQLLDVHGVTAHLAGDRLTDAADAEWYQRIEAMVLRGESAAARKILLSGADSHAASARSRLRLGRIELSDGNYSEARSIFEQILKQSPAESDAVTRAETLANMGEANRRLGSLSEASSEFSESIVLLSQMRDSRELGNAYLGRAVTLFVKGQPDMAYADLANARIAFEVAGDTLSIGRVDANEAAQAMFEGRSEKALQLNTKSAEVFERFGALSNLAMALSNQIGIYMQLERPAAALEIADRAGDRFDALPNSGLRNAFALRRAAALLASGRLTDGRRLLEAILQNKDAPDVPFAGIAQGMLAHLELESDRPEQANVLADEAMRALTASEFVSPRAAAWLERTRAMRLLKYADLPQQVAAFQEWALATQDSGAIALAHLAAAEESWSKGDREAAIALYQDTLDQVTRDRPPEEVVEVAVSYGNAMIDAGDLQRASAIAGRIAPHADGDFDCALFMVKFYRAMQQADAWRAALEVAMARAGERKVPESLRTLH